MSDRQRDVLALVERRGTIRVSDLAHELGISSATARRDVTVLAVAQLVQRTHGGARVLEPQQSLRHVESLRPGDAGAIGMLVPSLEFYWPDVARGAEAAARERGFSIMLRESEYRAVDELGDVDRLIAAGARGLLLAPTLDGSTGERMLAWLARSPVPIVLLERDAAASELHEGIDTVVTDHTHGVQKAARHLADRGHRKVGVALSQNSPHTSAIRRAWVGACERLGLTLPAVDATVPPRTDPDYHTVIDQVLDATRASGTSALLVHSDIDAIQLVQHADDRGVAIPGDLSVVSYDDQVAAMNHPALTAIRPPREAIGRTAFELLAARLADTERPAHRVAIGPALSVRETSGPAPTSAETDQPIPSHE
ncbi:LacI family DNA-binding transcriptional regulator [Ruania alba]|uniref:DNA-binding transcriptional regulator, LacI/PurR family n=1 Tax=Ruania alba TaxID=648782 RepID=A0A1H5HYE5_9MICO|nr:substrate-binding domain-containing protein [Ruania alba]SEE32939.1 DNA-binding transcriptional regulator, LacI/PurR family [Ruania alba]